MIKLKPIIFILYSLLKILKFSSYKHRFQKNKNLSCNKCFVLGTGPSLNIDMPKYISGLLCSDIIVVNDFALSEHYKKLKPKKYVLVDPLYFEKELDLPEEYNQLRDKLYYEINNTTMWALTIFIPYSAYKTKYFQNYFKKNNNIIIKPFNRLTIVGSTSFLNYCYKNNFASPTGSNVLISAIYIAINSGYEEINILGADHSWTEDLRVNSKNEVCYINRHCYDNEELALSTWFKSNGKESFKMGEILSYLASMFNGHEEINTFALYSNTKIINCSSKSYIDAYARISHIYE